MSSTSSSSPTADERRPSVPQTAPDGMNILASDWIAFSFTISLNSSSTRAPTDMIMMSTPLATTFGTMTVAAFWDAASMTRSVW